MRDKIKKILSIVLIGIMFGAIPAVADIVWGPISWNHVQGIPSVRETCNLGETPYLHWVLEGVDKSQDYSLYLDLSGTGSGHILGEREGNSGTYQFDSGFFTLNGLDATVLNVPDGNNLVISGGCKGTQIPEFPLLALPIAAVIGLVFFFQQKKKKVE